MTKHELSWKCITQQCQKLAHKLRELPWAVCDLVYGKLQAQALWYITKQDGLLCIRCPSMASDKHDLILKLERLYDKQWKEKDFQTRIFLSAFKSSYSYLSHIWEIACQLGYLNCWACSSLHLDLQVHLLEIQALGFLTRHSGDYTLCKCFDCGI